MAYLRNSGERSVGNGPADFRFGCGGSCGCRACRTPATLGERYVPDEEEDEPQAEPPQESRGDVLDGFGETPCPAPAQPTTERCTTPQVCPPIPGMVCMRSIGGVGFEYVQKIAWEPATKRYVVARREARAVRATAEVGAALERFIAAMTRFGMPLEAILTLGSYYCRCISDTDQISDHGRGEAIDIAGVRLRGGREIVVRNFWNAADAPWLRRINACLRLSFPLVLDYDYNEAHHDHFHCDLNRGRGRSLGKTTMAFAAKSLASTLRQPVPQPQRWEDLLPPLMAFAGRPPAGRSWREPALLNGVLDRLFASVATGNGAAAAPPPPQAVDGRTSPEARPGNGEAEAVRRAVASGVRNPGAITDQLFHRRHPSLGGRRLQPHERQLTAEWLAIRDRIVRPELSRAANGAR